MRQAAAKLSVSVPGELAAEVRRRVGARGLSGFVARAIAHELEREQLNAPGHGRLPRPARATRARPGSLSDGREPVLEA